MTVVRDNEEKIFAMVLKDNADKETIVRSANSASLNSLGADFNDLNDKEKKQLGISGGAKISNLNPGKLRSAGIREGFIITSIDNQKVGSIADLEKILSDKKGGVLMEGIYPNGMRAYYGFGL